MDHDDSHAYKFPHQTYISRELVRYAKASAPPAPSGETVREVYDAYSKEEWKDLIADLDRANLEPLLTYLQANEHELTRARGEWIKETDDIERRVRELAAAARLKYSAVFGAAVTRSLILKYSQGDWETNPLHDPLWAALWKEIGAPQTSKKRTPDESRRPRAIAEALGYDPDNIYKRVAEWLERMEELPFEEFVKRYGGDLSDYLTWVRRPRIHNKLQSREKRRKQ
jgi:hypothetical protein